VKRLICFILAAAFALCLSPAKNAVATAEPVLAGGRTDLSFTYTPAAPIYTVTVSGIWTKGDTNGLICTCNAGFDKFTNVEVDGALLDAVHYTAVSGSTIITLVPEYLETLTVGDHSIKLILTDGSVQTWFTIREAATLVSATTTVKNLVSITETAKNSGTWVVTFTVTLVYSDGTTKDETFSISLSGNNINQSGQLKFGDDHILSGYTLVYDIKGDGSNIKDFRLILNSE